jgi:hypothetical protein
MANFGYDPTGTGRYGVGTLYNGVSGVNVLADGTKYYGDINTLVNGKLPVASTPESPNSGNGQSQSLNLRKLPISISVPGNIITEGPAGSELLIVEELFDDLSLFELMDLGRSEAVLGLNITYQPIKNLSDIYFTYDPKRILALSGIFTESSSALDIGQYTADVVDGSVYLDSATGDLIIAVDNVKDGFVVQIEMLSGGEIQDLGVEIQDS